jgi:hypothetical protein
MRFTSETTSNGVSERHFTLRDIPGVLWLRRHTSVPAFELQSSERFFARHLVRAPRYPAVPGEGLY